MTSHPHTQPFAQRGSPCTRIFDVLGFLSLFPHQHYLSIAQMLAASKLFAILVRVRRFLLQAVRSGFVPQALKWFWGRLAYFWAHLRLRSRPSSQNPQSLNTSSPASCVNTIASSRIVSSDSPEAQKHALNFDDDYIPVVDGEIVSLQDVMPSIYPHSGDGIHNAAQSAKNLEVSRSAHASTVSLLSRESLAEARHASRHSLRYQHPESIHSGSKINVNVIPPQNSPPIDSTNVAFTENRSDTCPDEDPYLQPSISQSRNSGHSSAETSPTHETKPSGLEVVERSVYSSTTSLYGSEVLSTSWEVLGHGRIIPIMPEAVLRYDGRPTISKSEGLNFPDIHPVTKNFDGPNLPQGWEKLVHPEGACYFFNAEKRIYAEANICDQAIYNQLEEDATTIQTFGKSCYNIQESDNDTDLVIYISEESAGQLSTCYYYVDHQNQSIFFLDLYAPRNLSAWCQIYGGASSQSHLRHEIETQYWYHCQFFPHSSKLTTEKIQGLRDVVMHYVGDTMTSPKCSTAPYSLEDLRSILSLTNDMNQNVGGIAIGTHSCLARLMYIFTRARFLHFHGEPHARIDRTASVYGDDMNKRTWLVKLLSPILFFAPDFHLKNLQGLWVDQTLHKSVFKETMTRMNEDWDRIILFATVMLNANVAVLAIQSVDNINTSARSATQIASYVSMISSVGSIVVGLLLSRQNRTKFRETVDDFEKYLTDRSNPTHGLEIMAILYSLPHALLMWGMVSFALAVAFMCFMKSDIPTVSVVGVSTFFCVLFCLWCLYANWEEEDEWSLPEMDISGWFGHAKANLRRTFTARRQQSGPEVEQHQMA